MARRFGIVKTVRDDGSCTYDVGMISYEKDPALPKSINRGESLLALEGSNHFSNEDSIIMRLNMMLRDCQDYPVCVIKEGDDR